MGNAIKKSEVAKLLPRRDTESHKGQNGRVLIVGGSLNYFGAPVLAGLGALNGGADLVYLLVPECNFEVSRSFYPDFIVRKYPGNFINSRTLDYIKELLDAADCVLIGPGVTEDSEILRVITRIVEKTTCGVVLDAEAIPAIAQLREPRLIITPHRGELQQLIPAIPDDFDELIKVVEDFAQKWKATILLKGHLDIIAAPEMPTRVNETGNAGMTVGGTGDVLAGLTASFIAQGISPYEACKCAAYINGASGDALYRRKGYNFIATDLALELPYTIHEVIL